MADNGYTLDPNNPANSAVLDRIREMQRGAEASANAQRLLAQPRVYGGNDQNGTGTTNGMSNAAWNAATSSYVVDPSTDPANISSHNAWNVVAANRQAGIEQAVGINATVAPQAAYRYGGGANTSASTNNASTGTTGATATTTAGSGNTRTAITTPSATSTNTSSVAPGSYMQEGYSTGSERPILSDTSAYYTKAPEAPRSIAEIRQEQLDQAQKAIDATRGIYEDARQRRQTLGARQLAQTSAQNVGAGLAGSPFAQTNETGVNENTQYELNALANQRSADISRIFADAEDRAQTLYQNSLNNYYQERNFYVSERDKAMAEEKARREATKAAATNMITNIAKGGYSIDEMNPDEYKQLLYNSGMSDFEARAIWAASSPAANAQYSVQNGYLVGTYFDPHTGKPVVTTTPLPEGITPVDVGQIQLADGSVVLYDKNNPRDEFGNLIRIPFEGQNVTKLMEQDAPTVKTINGQDYEWDATTGSWQPFSGGAYTSDAAKEKQDKILGIIDELLADETALGNAVGPVSSLLPTVRGKTADYIQKFNQLKSLLTLDNLGLLKGAISDRDMQVLQSAGTALSLGMSESGFKSELNKLKSSIGKTSVQSDSRQGLPDVSSYQPDYEVMGQLNGMGTDFTGEKLTPGNIDYLSRYASKMRSEGKDENTIENNLKMLLNHQVPPDFIKVSSDTNAAARHFEKIASVLKVGEKAGQCAHVVNKYSGSRMGDSYASKQEMVTDHSIGTPTVPPPRGYIFVMPVSGKSKKYGHTGYVADVKQLPDGSYDILALDSNWNGDERIAQHVINSKNIYGYFAPPNINA